MDIVLEGSFWKKKERLNKMTLRIRLQCMCVYEKEGERAKERDRKRVYTCLLRCNWYLESYLFLGKGEGQWRDRRRYPPSAPL